tara:strand:- start:22 stop:603 length:582 start_codon:yes stop_codon:yes gene_type:complete
MEIILASKSGVRKQILENNNIECKVVVSNVDEDQIKDSLIAEGANPEIISKNLAELKSIKVSKKHNDRIVLGADSVVSLNNKIINKPKTRKEGLEILKKLNGTSHNLISSVCFSRNGSMIWNYTDTSELKMKKLSDVDLENYLKKIKTDTLLAYGVYQVESDGLDLFENIKGDMDSIMGLPVKKILEYLKELK